VLRWHINQHIVLDALLKQHRRMQPRRRLVFNQINNVLLMSKSLRLHKLFTKIPERHCPVFVRNLATPGFKGANKFNLTVKIRVRLSIIIKRFRRLTNSLTSILNRETLSYHLKEPGLRLSRIQSLTSCQT
jgi:hypothetical protein